MNNRFFSPGKLSILVLIGVIVALAATAALANPVQPRPKRNPGLLFVDYRDLKGGQDGVALIDLNPESKQFGRILQRKDIGKGVLPHHLYFNHEQDRLYTTTLGGSMLYELILDNGADGAPRIARVVPIDTGGNLVGEDMFFTHDNSRFYMTFLGGRGGPNGGSVGVFDAQTNRLIETIEAIKPSDPTSTQPYILHPHGISANEDVGILMVTNTVNPDLKTEVGNTVTVIDLATHAVLSTHLVADTPDDLSQPVEVLLLRDGLPPFALATTIAGDVWVAPYDLQTGAVGQFAKQVNGKAQGLGVALEFYIHTNKAGEKELYISFAAPGVIHVYSLDNLPALTLKRILPAGPGAHHMVFFETESGREVVVVQNNLLNAPGLNAGSLMVVDINSGEVVKTLDLPAQYGLMPESIESAFGHGHDIHH